MPEQVEYVDDAKVTHRDASKIERVVHANIVSSPTLQPGTTLITEYTLVEATREHPSGRDHGKSLAERLNAAYGNGLEPKERELLDRGAEQFGRRLTSKE